MSAREKIYEIIIPEEHYKALQYQLVHVRLKNGKSIKNIVLYRDGALLIPPERTPHFEGDQIKEVKCVSGWKCTEDDLEKLHDHENLRKVSLPEEMRRDMQRMVEVALKDGTKDHYFLKEGHRLLPSFDGINYDPVDISFHFTLEDIADIKPYRPKRFDFSWLAEYGIFFLYIVLAWPLVKAVEWLTSRSTPKSPVKEANRVEELGNNLLTEGRFGDLEKELKNLDQANLSPAEQESWWYLLGIVALREGRDSEALERFEAAYKRFPGSAQIRFSLGQQHITAGAVEKGLGLFRTCLFPEVPCEHAFAQARYAYIWNSYSDGLVFIRPFFEAYKKFKILDDHFLYVRGLPFFGRWWGYLAAFSVLSEDFQELESVTQFVTQNCDDYDFKHLQAELKAYRDDAPDHLLEALKKRLSSMPQGSPNGYTLMKIAVIKARAATTIAAAEEVLAGVVLSERDFPWLEDIRTLAQAEAAHRLGDPALEHERVEAFLKRQPMLLAPDIALNFHLLRYQENLKSRVRSADC